MAAKEILSEIEVVDIFDGVMKIKFEDGVRQGLISYIAEDTISAYIEAVSAQSLCGDEDIDKSVSIVYTPLNGAGLKCVTRCLKENGFTNISIVAEQKYPDGNFPTCPYPNPEIREALELGLRDAKRLNTVIASTLIETAKSNGAEPYFYLKYLLDVFCKHFLDKIAEPFWTLLHVHFGQCCRGLWTVI